MRDLRSISPLLNLRGKYLRKNRICRGNCSCCMCEWQSKNKNCPKNRQYNARKEPANWTNFANFYCLVDYLPARAHFHRCLVQRKPAGQVAICWPETRLHSSRQLCSPCCPGTQYVDQAGLELKRSAFLCIPSAEIKGVYHYAWPTAFHTWWKLKLNQVFQGSMPPT